MNELSQQPQPQTPDSFIGPKVLLIGDAGSGKTTSLKTLLNVHPKMEVFVLFTEPFMHVLGDAPADRMHWHYMSPSNASWETLAKMADNINRMPYDALTKMGATDKSQYRDFYELIRFLINPKCDRCGKTFECVDKWPMSRVLVFDGLSGISTMAMSLTVGSKPTRGQNEWGIAMNAIEAFVMRATMGINCPMVMIAHPEREQDGTTLQMRVYPSTLGRQLAPKLPKNFSDVIYAEQNGTDFAWSTAKAGYSTKAQNLPVAAVLKPDFVPLFQGWVKKGGVLV